jgi:hypothetical protein
MLRRQRPVGLLATLAVVACAAAFASPAFGGTYNVNSCSKSATKTKPNWTYDATAGGVGATPYFYTVTNCSASGLYRRFEPNPVAAGAVSAWTFNAPAGTWVQIAEFFQSATPRVAGSYDAIYAEMDDGTRRTLANAIGGTSSVLDDATYALPASGPHALRIRSELGCQSSANCDGQTASWEYGNVYNIAGTIMHLVDPSTPAIDTVSGTGWQAQPADGVSSINYTASDYGSGIAEVRFFVDGIQYPSNASACTAGEPVPCPLAATGAFTLDTTRLAEGAHKVAVAAVDYSGNAMSATAKELTITVRRAPQVSGTTPVSTTNPSANGGGSPAVGDPLQGNAGNWSGTGITYAYQWMRCDAHGVNCVPIPGATSAGYTPTAADVDHTLQFCVTATNSGGSATSCSAPTAVVVATRPAPASTADRPGQPATPGAPAATTADDRGHANGTTASDRVVLTALINNRSTTRKIMFGKRATITGRLVGTDGAPIKGATLSVQSQTAVPGASMADAAQVVTSNDGRFTYIAPAGPSRVVRLGYRSHTGDSSFADTTDVHLLVSAGVTMKATPKKVRNRHATVFTGRLLGRPIPARGVIVDLQVFFRKQWRTFGAPRTNRAGAYKFKYRFMAGAATWRFRARVRQETSYPYAIGVSRKPVKVRVVG